MDSPALILWEREPHEPIAARIAIAGDFIPAGDSLTLPTGGWREAAQPLNEYFHHVDCSLMNLEGTLDTHSLSSRKIAGLGQPVAANPECADYLRAARCATVGIANNHSCDFGAAGLQRTRSALMNYGLRPLGAGRPLQSGPEIFVWEGPQQIRVGFWAAARASHDLATLRRPGVEPATCERAKSALREIRSRGAQSAIALLHAGCLRTNRPDPSDLRLIDALASLGFTIVAASHSHRIAGAKISYANWSPPSFCFCGLGSIVSGYTTCPLEREGLLTVVCLDGRGDVVRVEVRPILIAENGFGGVPNPETGEMILARFRALGAEIDDGSFARLFYDDQSRGLLRLYFRDARAAFRNAGLRGLASKVTRVRGKHVRRVAHAVIG